MKDIELTEEESKIIKSITRDIHDFNVLTPVIALTIASYSIFTREFAGLSIVLAWFLTQSYRRLDAYKSIIQKLTKDLSTP